MESKKNKNLFHAKNSILRYLAFLSCIKLCYRVIAATQFILFITLSNISRIKNLRFEGTLKEIISWNCVLLNPDNFLNKSKCN